MKKVVLAKEKQNVLENLKKELVKEIDILSVRLAPNELEPAIMRDPLVDDYIDSIIEGKREKVSCIEFMLENMSEPDSSELKEFGEDAKRTILKPIHQQLLRNMYWEFTEKAFKMEVDMDEVEEADEFERLNHKRMWQVLYASCVDEILKSMKKPESRCKKNYNNKTISDVSINTLVDMINYFEDMIDELDNACEYAQYQEEINDMQAHMNKLHAYKECLDNILYN